MSVGEQVVTVDVDPVMVEQVERAMMVAPVEVPEHRVVASYGTLTTARQALQQSMDRRW